MVSYRWTEWRYPEPILNQLIYDYGFSQKSYAGLPDTYNNRGTHNIDGSEVLPYVKGIPTIDGWNDNFSSYNANNGPSGPNTFYSNSSATDIPNIGIHASTVLMNGGSIGGMRIMGTYTKGAWVLDMEGRLTYGSWPNNDPDTSIAQDIEWREGHLINAKFVIRNAATVAYAIKENVDTSYTVFDSPIMTNYPELLDMYEPWTIIDLVDLPDSTWINSRRRSSINNAYPYGHSIRPFYQLRDDSNLGNVLTSILPPNSSDPYESRTISSYNSYVETGYWHDIPNYESPIYTELKSDYCLVIAGIPRAYNIGSVPAPPRDPSQIFPSGYNPGSEFSVGFVNTRGNAELYNYSEEEGHNGWIASWQPPPYRLLIPGASPMRQRHRDDGLATDTRQMKGYGSSQQSSIRQGGRVYY